MITKTIKIYQNRLLSKHFCLYLFFTKDSVSLLFAKLTVSKFFLQSTGKFISNTFSDCRSIASTSFVWRDSCIEFYWEIRRKVDYCSRVRLTRLSFITQFKIEFLLLFTVCRKVLRKMPAKSASRLPQIIEDSLTYSYVFVKY